MANNGDIELNSFDETDGRRRRKSSGGYKPQLADPTDVRKEIRNNNPEAIDGGVQRGVQRGQNQSGNDIQNVSSDETEMRKVPSQVWIGVLGVIVTALSAVSFVVTAGKWLDGEKSPEKSPFWTGNVSDLKPWKPRVSRVTGFLAFLIPSCAAWSFTLVGLSYLWKYTLPKLYKKNVNESEKKVFGLCSKWSGDKDKAWHFFRVIVLTIFVRFWDAIDVCLDSYLFYSLEIGNQINANIQRNPFVSNAILIFAIFGCLKILLVFWFILLSQKSAKLFRFDEFMVIGAAASFILEDCPELYLEYFYVEKYITNRETFFLVKNTFLALVTLVKLILNVRGVIKDYTREQGCCDKPAWTRHFVFCGLILALIASLIRLGAGVSQYLEPSWQQECFLNNFDENVVFQTPFNCLSGVDWSILIINSLALFSLIVGFFLSCEYICAFLELNSDRDVDRPLNPNGDVER